jgi:tripartite-type tricarboxylate transporter receptor subunit TctC
VLSAGVLSFTVHISRIVVRIARPRWEKFMKLPHRRHFLHLAAGAAALPTLSDMARADTYPSRPVRIVVGFPPGGAQDILARLIGQQLSERLGQPFVVENKLGVATNLATELVVTARPDGHTLIVIGPPAAINATLYKDLKFNFIRDIAPIASFIRQPFVMLVNPAFPIKTIAELIEYAKTNPDKLTMAGNGQGGGPHMAGELFKIMADVKMITVQYRGEAPALTDLLGGQVHVYFSSIPGAIELIKTKQLRALGVTSATRSNLLSEVPAVAEFVPGYEMSAVFGVGAPQATPTEIIDKLNAAINEIIADAKMQARLSDLGGTVIQLSPAEYRELIIGETEKWAKVIREANIKAE